MTSILLLHGGLWEDMDAGRFWVRPGIVAGLRGLGYTVLAPDRLRRPQAWAADVDHIVSGLPEGPVAVVAGSNACSVGALLAVARPESVRALVFAWPATAGDPGVDNWTRDAMLAQGASSATIDSLLAGGVLRGVSDVDLAGLAIPVAVLPSLAVQAAQAGSAAQARSTAQARSGSPFHLRRTVDALLALVPGAVELPGCPESPRPDFNGHLGAFLSAVTRFVG